MQAPLFNVRACEVKRPYREQDGKSDEEIPVLNAALEGDLTLFILDVLDHVLLSVWRYHKAKNILW